MVRRLKWIIKKSLSFNPLNQVYVFNGGYAMRRTKILTKSFNPLNQVYVFNYVYKEKE